MSDTTERGLAGSEAAVSHTWFWCPICGWSVRCGGCGNNCCNGGETCEQCPSAYEKMYAEAAVQRLLPPPPGESRWTRTGVPGPESRLGSGDVLDHRPGADDDGGPE